MTRINISLPDETLARLDRVLTAYKRSQYLDYAAKAMLARLRGDALGAIDYERACRALLRRPGGGGGR